MSARKMTVRANAKVNWALNLTGIRENGYHELDMLMQSVSLHDTLEIETAEDDAVVLTCDRADVPCDEKNLVMKAALALKKETGCRRGARMHLIKRIPSQAGLGGGSADCAAALRALNALWELNLGEEQLMEIGLRLGADVPFCLAGGLQRARGLGEVLTAVACESGRRLLIVKPHQGLSTPQVFRLSDQMPASRPADIEKAAQALLAGDDALLCETAANMLTGAAVSLCPQVGETLQELRARGASFAAMSGSGTACAALFADEEMLQSACENMNREGMSVFVCETAEKGVCW